MMNKACSWLGHKYQPRYDYQPGTFESQELPAFYAVAIIEACSIRTYVRDVCVRCGHALERNTAP